jgi:prevent-host-death family protein
MRVKEIGLFDAKTTLSELIKRVMAGDRFYITRRGQRVAELRPVAADKKPLERGCARNDGYFMSSDFDDPIEDLKEYT